MDGFTAARAIRDSERHGAHLPIIALTADVQPETRARCQDAGMDDYLAKPFDRRSLLELLVRWWPAAQPAPHAARPEPQAVDVPANAARLSRAAALFIVDTPALIYRLDSAAQSGAHATLRELAHRLKSSSASVGALPLSALAAALEADAAALEADAAAPVPALDWSARIPPLRAAFEQARSALQGHETAIQPGA